MENQETDSKQAYHNEGFEIKEVAISIDNNNDSDGDGVNLDRPSGNIRGILKTFVKDHEPHFKMLRNIFLLAGYAVYFVFAMLHTEDDGTEERWRLVAMTTVIALLTARYFFRFFDFSSDWILTVTKTFGRITSGKPSIVIKWFLYVAMATFMVVYVVVMVAIKNPENLWSLLGLVGFPVLLWLYSNNRRKVNWHTVFWGMSLQFVMALLILKTYWGAYVISWLGKRLEEYISVGSYGSIFMFGPTYTDHRFAMGTTVNILVLMVGISVLTHIGAVRAIVNSVGRPLASCLQVTPVEGINAIANIFLHVPESAFVVQEYLLDLKPSELFVTYAGGMATVGGTSLVVFMSFGVPAAPLLAASAMSSPAAIVASKLVFPSTADEPERVPEIGENDKPADGAATTKEIRNRNKRNTNSLMASIVVGIDGWIPLVLNAVAFIMTFVMVIAFINRTLTWFGDRVGIEDLTIEFIFSYIFYPLAYMMGARKEHCLFIGELLGIRTFSLAIVAFPKLGPIMQNGIKFRDYMQQAGNNTWRYVGDDILLERTNQTLVGGVMDPRSETIAIYSLCGSASIAIMGFIIGTFGTLIPSRREEITKHIFRAMVAGTVASYLTACFAGLLFEESLDI